MSNVSDRLIALGNQDVSAMLEGRDTAVIDVVRRAYEAHAREQSSLPFSSFVRFPDSDLDRIIALPGYLGEDFAVAGIKWIASVPANLERGIERASAAMILNERATGRPYALLEGSLISKQRTAASAALAAGVFCDGKTPETIGFIGCGPINAEVARFLNVVLPGAKQVRIYDLSPERAESFKQKLSAIYPGAEITATETPQALLEQCPLISFATTAGTPHIDDLSMCPPGTTVLHVSLRDLTPEVILANHNVVDDYGHVCRARTSIHLAAEKSGNGDFVHCSLGDLLLGRNQVPSRDDGKILIFSPFGLGVLDLAVAQLVYEAATKEGRGTPIDSFLPSL